MKIGIITFHHNNNFGAALQCYALQKTIAGMGHDVDVIDYVPGEGQARPFWRGWNIRSGQFFKTARQRMLQLRYERRATRAFTSFRENHFPLSPRCVSLGELQNVAERYDAVVCGSDQVWVFERPSAYFLDLGKNFKGLKISYAACCGHNRQRADRHEEIKALIADLDFVSVRNDFTREIIQPMTEDPVEVVADPTLLVDFETLMRAYPLPFVDYLLVYSLSADADEREGRILPAIKRAAGNLPVVAVVANSRPQKGAATHHHVFDADPGQWIWLLSHARFVYTDSFHGALFCAKYGRPFIADYKEEWRALRLLDAAQRYGFEDRIASTAEDAIEKIGHMKTDRSASLARIATHAEQSVRFLKRALGE